MFNRFFHLLGFSLFLIAVAPAAHAAEPARERLSFNQDWRFAKGDPAGTGDKLSYANTKRWLTANAPDPAGGLDNPVATTGFGFDDSSWRKLDLPHDWGVEGPFRQEFPGETGKLEWWGVAWYRKHFTSPASDAGKRVYLDIDGAMSYSTVWLNGRFVGGWPYGYASYRVDLTPYLKAGGENVLAIRLDNPPESSRWYPGGGIYRNVWLVKTAAVHVAQWGTQLTTPIVSADAATVDLQITVDNQGADTNVKASTVIHALDEQGRKTGPVLAESVPTGPLRAWPGKQTRLSNSLQLPKPRLWSPKTPSRYVAVTTISGPGGVLDVYETPFGVRTIAFDAARGFVLNGEHVPLQGVCAHHDLGALGAALNLRALERQLEILREMGVNAIRTSHNPPAPELLDLADRMGFLIIDEAFDMWQSGKKKNDYSLLFADWHEKDLRALVQRDRNHPSVILWSIGNEIREQGTAEGWKMGARLSDIVRSEDRTRLTVAGFNHATSAYNGMQTAVDVMGYNYKPDDYTAFHRSAPQMPVIGSETASTISSRGEYFFPVSDDKATGQSNFQVSSYDLSAPRWAFSPDVEFRGLDRNPFVAGEFVWTGFDYLGEPTPYNADTTNLLNFTDPAQQQRAAAELASLKKIAVPSRSSYFGIIDLAGFKKDRFYLYQARWRPELPMAHLLPHWNWPERVGQVTPVHVYTSGDEAELFLNGVSQGRKKRAALEYRLRWDDVTYQPGSLRVVSYKDGKPWAEDKVSTTGAAAKLALDADRATLRADGHALSFVTVRVADAQGATVPRTANPIKFSLSGPGEIVATDNGDATSFVSFQSRERPAFNGLALVIVRTRAGQVGKLTLTATSKGLRTATVALRSE